MTDTLKKRQTVSELVGVYQRAAAEIQECFGRLGAAEAAMNHAFSDEGYSTFSLRTAYGARPFNFATDADHVIEMLRADVWWRLFEILEVKRFMSVKRFEQLKKDVEARKMPEITVETVFGAFNDLTSKMDSYIHEAVDEVFQFLRPRGQTKASKYKTNTEWEVGQKVILTHRIESTWSDMFDVSHYYEQEMTAPENVFSALDGKGTATKEYYSKLSQAIKKTPVKSDGRGETEYFRFRCCKNGNLHIEFKRLDLLVRFNAMAGGKNLKGEVTK